MQAYVRLTDHLNAFDLYIVLLFEEAHHSAVIII